MGEEVKTSLNKLRSFLWKPVQCQQWNTTALLHAQGERPLGATCYSGAPHPDPAALGRGDSMLPGNTPACSAPGGGPQAPGPGGRLRGMEA